MENSKAFLKYIVQSIVAHPDQVQVDGRVDELGVLLTLKVSKEDMGGIIGKAGATAKAIRALTRIVGLRENSRVNVRIEEPDGSNFV